MTLYQKKIVLGISGSIAAYKAPMIVRELIKRGAEVRVIMTPSAEKFVSKTVLMNLSKYPVAIELFEDDIQSGGSCSLVRCNANCTMFGNYTCQASYRIL